MSAHLYVRKWLSTAKVGREASGRYLPLKMNNRRHLPHPLTRFSHDIEKKIFLTPWRRGLEGLIKRAAVDR